jgi:hypothetical protein
MDRKITTRIRNTIAATALIASAAGVGTVAATPASAQSYDDTYYATFLGGAHQGNVVFSSQGPYGHVNIRDGAGDSFCTAIEYRGTFSNAAWTRSVSYCNGRSGSVNFTIPGWTGSIDFRAVTGSHVGATITCWRGTDDVNKDGIRDFCS